MAVPFRYAFEQGPMIAALGRVALSGFKKDKPSRAPVTPGPWLEDRVAPRPEDLIRAYVRHVGGDPGWYRGRVPPHLFPQWSFPLGARALEGLGYPIAKVINGGCRIEQGVTTRAACCTHDGDGSEVVGASSRVEGERPDGQGVRGGPRVQAVDTGVLGQLLADGRCRRRAASEDA